MSWIAQGFKDVISAITSLIDFLNPFSENFILKKIIDWLNPFGEDFILKDVITFLGDLLSYINPFSDNFFGYKIIDLFSDLFKFLFIPDEKSITDIISIVESKFDFIYTIKEFITSLENIFNNLVDSPSLSVNIGATKYTESQKIDIINLNWYKPFKPYGDLVLTGFIYAFYLWRLYISLPNIISGSGGIVHADYMVSDIQAFHKFGFGRMSSINKYQDRNGGTYRK